MLGEARSKRPSCCGLLRKSASSKREISEKAGVFDSCFTAVMPSSCPAVVPSLRRRRWPRLFSNLKRVFMSSLLPGRRGRGSWPTILCNVFWAEFFLRRGQWLDRCNFSRSSYLTSSFGKRALMIFSIGRVVYIYSLANFLDRDSVHCGGRPILAPPFESPATELGDATSSMTRLCGSQETDEKPWGARVQELSSNVANTKLI